MAAQPRLSSSLRQRDRSLDVPAAVDPVGRGEPDPDGLFGRESGSHGIEDLEREAHAVLERAAVRVRALIGERRQELMQQVAVCAMHFEPIDPKAGGTAGRGREIGLDAVEAGPIQGDRRFLAGSMRQGRRCNRHPTTGLRRGDLRSALPGHPARRLAPGVGQLHRHGHRGISAYGVQHATEGGFGGVGVEAEVTWGDAGLRAIPRSPR